MLQLFSYTLRNVALEWLDAKPHGIIIALDDLTRKILQQILSIGKVAKIRLKIQTF